MAETESRRETVTFRRGPVEELSNGLLRQKILAERRAQTWFVLQREEISLAAAWDKRQGFLPHTPVSAPAVHRLSPDWFRDLPIPGGAEQPCPAAQ